MGSEVVSVSEYAGDISVERAWEMLASEPDAALIDVRTRAEWSYVGGPDLAGLTQAPLYCEWQTFPDMAVNEAFVREVSAALKEAGTGLEAPLLCLCRSGVRSRHAAIALSEAGAARAYNIAGGFEGDCDDDGHRGRVNGWKVAGLPWKQP